MTHPTLSCTSRLIRNALWLWILVQASCTSTCTVTGNSSRSLTIASTAGQPLHSDLILDPQDGALARRATAQLIRVADRQVVGTWISPRLQPQVGLSSTPIEGLVPAAPGEYELLVTVELDNGETHMSSETLSITE